MKPLLLIGCALLANTSLRAQFSLLPYAGLEQSRTAMNYGDASSLSVNGNLKAGVRFNYQLKGGHSPFINLTTNPAPVHFAFDNAGSLLNTFREGNVQFRLEGGYQYNSGPIRLGKGSNAAKQNLTNTTTTAAYQKGSCGSSPYKSRCSRNRSASKTVAPNGALNMRLQPSLAMAYVPAAANAVKQNPNGFEYTVATGKTALVPAMGFEFAKGSQRLFTLGVFYTRPLSQNSKTITTVNEGKILPMEFAPKASAWGLTLGVPIGFAKPKPTKAKTERKSSCSGMYRRCTRVQ